jgi:hypothetical protein
MPVCIATQFMEMQTEAGTGSTGQGKRCKRMWHTDGRSSTGPAFCPSLHTSYPFPCCVLFLPLSHPQQLHNFQKLISSKPPHFLNTMPFAKLGTRGRNCSCVQGSTKSGSPGASYACHLADIDENFPQGIFENNKLEFV